jgi:hypothetical protein
LRGLPNAILDAILLDKGFQFANAVRIAHVDSDGGGLAEGGDWRWQVDNGCRLSCKENPDRRQGCNANNDYKDFSHISL